MTNREKYEWLKQRGVDILQLQNASPLQKLFIYLKIFWIMLKYYVMDIRVLWMVVYFITLLIGPAAWPYYFILVITHVLIELITIRKNLDK